MVENLQENEMITSPDESEEDYYLNKEEEFWHESNKDHLCLLDSFR